MLKNLNVQCSNYFEYGMLIEFRSMAQSTYYGHEEGGQYFSWTGEYGV